MFFCNIVALVVTLDVSHQCLEVEVGQSVLNLEHDILKEFVIKLRCPWEEGHIGSVLWQAPVDDCVVFIISINNLLLEPLVWLVSHKAEAWFKFRWAIHFSMGTVVRSEDMILTDWMLHEWPSVIHVRVDCLTTSPLLLCEWFFVDVQNLEPSSHEMMLIKGFMEVWDSVTDNILDSNLGVVNWLKCVGHGLRWISLFIIINQ